MRRTKVLRDLVRETDLSAQHLVQPLFVVAGESVREEVPSMPGVERLSITELVAEATEIQAAGVGAVILFGIPSERTRPARAPTTPRGSSSSPSERLKESHPDLLVITDVCMCEYTSTGTVASSRDGPRWTTTSTLELLAQTAISHAEAGADVVAPSDMMDGRVGVDPLTARRGGPLRRGDHGLRAPSTPRAFYGPVPRGRGVARPSSATGADTRWTRPTPARRARGRARSGRGRGHGNGQARAPYLDVIRRVKDASTCRSPRTTSPASTR